MSVKFYSAWFCPYAQRAWITLEHHKIPYEYIESLKVNKNQNEGNHGYEKNPRLLELNPKGLVPTLEVPCNIIGNLDLDNTDKSKNEVDDDVVVLTESIECMEFLNSGAGKKDEKNLVPDQSLLLDANAFNQNICSVFYHVLMKPTEEDQRCAFKIFVQNIAEFMEKVFDDGFYKCSSPTIVDFAVIPWLLRLPLLDHYRPRFDFIEFMDTPCIEKLNAYLERMKSLRAVKETLWKDEKALIEVYKRYANGTAKSQVGNAVRSGKNAHDV